MNRKQWCEFLGGHDLIANKQEQEQVMARFRAAGCEMSDVYQEAENANQCGKPMLWGIP